MSDLTRLNPTPHAIAVYASQPLSPVATQHSLPSRTLPFTWAGLSPAGSHQLCLAHSFDHLVSAYHEGQRHVDAERLGGFEVDDQFKPAGLLDGELGRLGALQDLVHIHRAAPKQVIDVRAICDETTDLDKLQRLGHERQSVGC